MSDYVEVQLMIDYNPNTSKANMTVREDNRYTSGYRSFAEAIGRIYMNPWSFLKVTQVAASDRGTVQLVIRGRILKLSMAWLLNLTEAGEKFGNVSIARWREEEEPDNWHNVK